MHARYRLANLIGQGGMGTICRAYDRLTHTWVALKQLILDDSDELSNTNAELRTALATEFRLLATLRHPHIVSVLDYGFLDQTAFFTMEFLAEASPLTHAAHAQPLSTQLQWLGQLLQTLEYLRRHQVIHRDLKPANVLVHHQQIKVLDFGLAVLEGQTSTTAGSIFYMAPEVLNRQAATHATDLFAVGVMVYEILAGQRPFAASNVKELVQQICTHEPDYARLAGPPALRPVIARLLAKDPAARFATASEALTAFMTASDNSAGPETPAVRASFIQAAQFVGRTTERVQLTEALNQAVAGHGSTWLLSGESGVGKSRLLEELRIQALVQGIQTWPGQAVGEGGQPAQLWHTILRWLLLTTPPTALAASVLKPFVPQLEELLEHLVAEAPPLEASSAQARFCATVLTLLRQAAAQHPLVLLLEDLHWADDLSLTLLSWLNRAAPELRLLIVATYRNDERPTLPKQLPAMTVLALERFTAEQVASLTSAILGLPVNQLAHLAAFLLRETEGNAFFVVEALRSLAEEAGLLGRVTHMSLPEQLMAGGMQQVVQRRLQQVAVAARPYLNLAAIMGRQLDLRVLQQLAPALDWSSWLSHCAEAAVLAPMEVGWQFAHDKLRQGVLAALPAAQAGALHQAVAAAIEQVYASELTPHLGQLAHHYAQTPQTAKCRYYLEQAGHAAFAIYANADAARYFSQALALTPPTALAQRYALLLAHEQVCDLQGLRAAQLQDLQALEALANALADPACQMQVALRRSIYYALTSQYTVAIEAAQQAWAYAQAFGDLTQQAMVQLRWGTALWLQGHYAAAHSLLESALALARAAQATAVEVDILRQLARLAWRQNHLQQAQALAQQGWQLAQTLHDQRREAELLGILATITENLGAFSLALSYHQQAIQQARAIGYRHREAINLNSLGGYYTFLGLYPQAHTHLTEAVRLSNEIGHRHNLAVGLSNQGQLYYDWGDLAQAQACFEHSLQILQTIGNGIEKSYVALGLGHTQLHLGQPQKAQATFEAGYTQLQALQRLDLATECQAGLAAVALADGNLAAALNHVETVLTYLASHDVNNTQRPLLIFLICYRVLQAAGDARAPTVLATAAAELQNKAAGLDAETRQAFLENVPWHREILALRPNQKAA